MHICIEGCAHGDLDTIYRQIANYEAGSGRKVDLLICCGDFQATRNLDDLACMAVPAKYLEMGSFFKYYAGHQVAPILTIFIGGNHEASNHLQELAYGGWVAPNIYYLGYAGVIHVNDVVIGGISGIYRDYLYSKGHFEFPPYDNSTIRSAYAVRNLEVFRLSQMTPSKINIMVSHDWPQKIWEHGNRNMQCGRVEGLLRLKPAFKADMDSGKLGSPPCMELLRTLKPAYWFSAHMHCRFDALVQHNEKESTIFAALDKCLPSRKFFEFMDCGKEVERDENGEAIFELKYDAEWLTILTLTNKFLNCTSSYTKLPMEPRPSQSVNDSQQRWNFTPTEEEIEATMSKFNNDLTIKYNFKQTVNAFTPEWERVDPRNLKQPEPTENLQTKEFCAALNIDDPLFVAASLQKVKVKSVDYHNDDDAFKDCSELEQDGDKVHVPQSKKIGQLQLPKPVKNDEEICLDDLDDSDNECDKDPADEVEQEEQQKSCKLSRPLEVDEDEEREKSESNETANVDPSPIIKKFKRRNQDIYAASDD